MLEQESLKRIEKCSQCGTKITVPPTERNSFDQTGLDSRVKKPKGYVARSIGSGDRVVYQTKLHWIIFTRAAIFFVAGLVLIWMSKSAAVSKHSDIGFFVGIFLLGLGFLFYLTTLMNRTTSEFAITNRWIIIKLGWIRRETFELLLDKAESIQVQQGVWGRLLNYGTITISGTGGARDVFYKISRPWEFRNRVHEQLQQSHN